MMMTEAEAGSVICPVLSALKDVGCLGSGCMVWRWEDPAENIRIDGLPDDAYRSKDLLDPRGFCGLAVDPRVIPK